MEKKRVWLPNSDANYYSSPQARDTSLNNDLSDSWQGWSTSDGTADTAASLEMGLAGPGKDRLNDERPSYSVMS